MTSQAAQSKWRPYPEYKDSGVEWLGEVPEHWGIAPMKYITRFINGAPFKPADWGDEGYPIIRIENLNGGAEFNYTTLQVDPKYHVKQGDLLFAWSGNRGTSFGPFLWNNEGMYYLNQHIFRLDGFELNKEYFYLLLKGVTAHVEKQAHGIIGLVHITKQELGSIGVPVLPEDEQRAIAAFLDHKTAKIDALIEKKQRLIRLLEEKRAAIISHAVTKGLDPDAPMKDSGVEWLGEIPAEWKPHRNGTLFIERDERGYPDLPLLNVSLHTGVSVREFSSDKIEQMADDKSTYKRAKRDDIVFNKMRMWQGAVGVAPTDGLVSPDYTVAIPRKNVHSKYFEYLFRTSLYKTETNRYSHGIVPDRNRLYWDQFKQMKSIYPPFSEQMEIVNKIDQQSNNIDCLINLIQKGIERLQEYRTALISAAVTGKIDVREASL